MPVDIATCTKEEVLKAAGCYLPGESLTKLAWMVRASNELYSGFSGENLICVWGLIPPSILSDKAYVWLHCTPAMVEHKFVLVRHSQLQIARLLEKYSQLYGFCNADNPMAVRWLEWCGAIFDKEENGRKHFVITRKLNG